MTLLRAALNALALELGTLLLKTSFDGFGVTVVMFTMLDRNNVVFVALRKHFAVLYGLNRSMEMILVNFPIDGCLGLFMTMFRYGLLSDSGSDSLMNGGVVVTSLVPTRR